MLLLLKLGLMGVLLLGGLKTYADVSFLNKNPMFSGISGIVLVVLMLVIFPKLIGFVIKFTFFCIVILWICHAAHLDFDSIIEKLSAVNLVDLDEALPVFKSPQQTLEGTVSTVNSGHSFVFNGESMELFGVDTPDVLQLCKSSNSMIYSCGERSATELNALVAGQNMQCSVVGQSYNGAKLATCYVDGNDVAAMMVRDGWAIADRTQSEMYVEEEKSAYLRKAGLWNGKFRDPKKWRLRYIKESSQSQKEKSAPSSEISVWRGIKKMFGLE